MGAPVLIAAAVMLGALSFFEPCTIATHTLFAARAHSLPRYRLRALANLWLARSVLAGGLMVVAAVSIDPPTIGALGAGAALTVVATIYLVSRFVYIPVPHLEFWRLLPGGAGLSQAVKLGLTLPACTLPLFMIVLACAVVVQAWGAAVLAGLLFAGVFTLPTVVTAVTGLTAAGRHFLSAAASATPYVTAVLLYGAAVYLLVGG